MKNGIKSFLCRGSAFIISAGVPIAATASYYDFFVQRGDTTVSAVALMAIILGLYSLKDTVLKYFKSPSAIKVWAAVFVLAYITSRIAEQFVVISMFGLAAQGISIPLHMLDKKYYNGGKNNNLLEALNEQSRK